MHHDDGIGDSEAVSEILKVGFRHKVKLPGNSISQDIQDTRKAEHGKSVRYDLVDYEQQQGLNLRYCSL